MKTKSKRRKAKLTQGEFELEPVPAGKMRSENSITRGQVIDIPPAAQVLYDAMGDPIYKCPHCGNWASDECNREFSTDCAGAA